MAVNAPMDQIYSVSDVAALLRRDHGIHVAPRVISDLLYRRAINADICPILSGRRVIPGRVVADIADLLRRRAAAKDGGAA